MKKIIFILFVFTSCARIPVQVVELSDALKDEGERMHQLNLALVNKLFFEKRHMINEFIVNVYAPEFLKDFKSTIPPDEVDYEADFEQLVQAAYPRINATRDSLISVLEEQKNIITEKLNADYKVFNNAFTEMQNLLRSASKLNQQRTEVFQQVKALTNNRVDIEAVEKAVEKFIKDGGEISNKAAVLTNTIKSLIK
jgi:hypothetical protein